MLKVFIDGIVAMVNLFGKKPSVFKVLSTVLSFLPALIRQAIDFTKADAGAKFDEFLQALDDYTGEEPGAVKLFPHLPLAREEQFWDAIKTAVELYGNSLLKRPGYFVE